MTRISTKLGFSWWDFCFGKNFPGEIVGFLYLANVSQKVSDDFWWFTVYWALNVV